MEKEIDRLIDITTAETFTEFKRVFRILIAANIKDLLIYLPNKKILIPGRGGD